MKTKDGKIVEATELEMYDKWLDEDWCYVYDFEDYLERCKKNGTKIVSIKKDLTSDEKI